MNKSIDHALIDLSGFSEESIEVRGLATCRPTGEDTPDWILMTHISFSKAAVDTFTVRKGLYRLILVRAKNALDNPADIEELEMSEFTDGISLFRKEASQRRTLGNALLEGARVLRSDLLAGRRVEEPVRDGVTDYLDELIDFLASHLGTPNALE